MKDLKLISARPNFKEIKYVYAYMFSEPLLTWHQPPYLWSYPELASRYVQNNTGHGYKLYWLPQRL